MGTFCTAGASGKVMNTILRKVTLLLALCLAGCGGVRDTGFATSGPLVDEPAAVEVARQAYSEFEFRNDPGLRLVPAQSAVLSLEAANDTEEGTGDSGTPGVDIVPLRLLRAQRLQLSFDPEDGTVAQVTVRDLNGQQLALLEATRPQVSLALGAEDYEVLIHSGFSADDDEHRVVFFASGAESLARGLAGDEAVYEIKSKGRCINCLLRGVHLSELRIQNGDLSFSFLAGAVLDDVTFMNTQLDSTEFRGADLGDCRFIEVTSDEADFEDATLTDCRIGSGCKFGSMNLKRATAVGLTIADDAIIVDSSFDGATMRGLQADKANFNHSSMVGVNLTRDDKGEFASLVGARLVGVNLSGAFLVDADLREANLTEAVLENAHAQGANFRDAILTKANFTGADLRGADLRGAVTTGMILNGAKTEGTKF